MGTTVGIARKSIEGCGNRQGKSEAGAKKNAGKHWRILM
jgi:hypothetical protein